MPVLKIVLAENQVCARQRKFEQLEIELHPEGEREEIRLVDLMAIQGKPLPRYVRREFEEYLKCGRLKHGFLRLRCDTCQAERLLAFRCKRRGICPSCGARRMVESAALLVDEILPQRPMRQLAPWKA